MRDNSFLNRCAVLIMMCMCALTYASQPAYDQPERFKKPKLEGVRLAKDCVDLLKKHDEKLKAAHAAKTLIAWSPLISVLTSSDAPEAAITILETDWDSLAQGVSNIDKIVFRSLEKDSELHALEHDRSPRNPKLYNFWIEMSKFYRSRIP